MLSTAGHVVDIDFNLSHATCSIGAETLSMISELGEWVLASHSTMIHEANQTIQETVRLDRKRKEYRATLSLAINTDMEAGPFQGLVKLVKRATEALFVEVGDQGFGAVAESGEFEGVKFEAFWTWYEYLNGDVKKCNGPIVLS